nr:urate oxidase [Chloroflexota bacterium]
MKTEIHYGKAAVSTYRTYATPLRGVTPIPESPFTGRGNVLFAAELDVRVLGEGFLSAYTEGDNRQVVATDTMKNFIHRESMVFAGSTLEGWLFFIGRRFLETYPHME